MAVIAGDLVTRLGIDGRKFQSGMQKARGEARSFVSDVGKIISGLAIYDIGKSIVSSFTGIAKSTVTLAADAQVMRAEFGVLLGDVDKGSSMFKQIEKFAARTSFNIESASDAMRSLMAAGVKEGDLLDTMQLLGDLSLGDANKLGFLSKAYTDVFNKGRLQGQEIKQFAENGVGLVQALSTTLGKPAGEILKMSENGQISFKMMQDALKSLTAEGGRFFGAMEAKNKTFWGQWDSTIEAIQSTGRALGEMVLPKLTEILSETNKIVKAFNALGDARWKFLGDVLVASFDVAMETIKLHWKDVLHEMKQEMSVFAVDIIPGVATAKQLAQVKKRKDAPQNLAEAQNRFNALIGQLNPPPEKPFEWQGPREQGFAAGVLRNMNRGNQKPAASILDVAKGMFETLQGKLAAGQMGIGGMIDRAKIQGGAMLGTLENWFTSQDWEKNKQKQEPRLAGAMQKGSQEAFSAIFAAMINRGKDPVVKATERGAASVVKAIKQNKPQTILAMGAVNP